MGCFLLLLDRLVPSLPRERALIAYYRYKGGAQAVGPSISAVLELGKSTGFRPDAKSWPSGKCGWRWDGGEEEWGLGWEWGW